MQMQKYVLLANNIFITILQLVNANAVQLDLHLIKQNLNAHVQLKLHIILLTKNVLPVVPFGIMLTKNA
jgi:hypothetical protein